MRLSALNIWASHADRHAQQQREVRENSNHPLMVWKMWEHTIWGDSIGWMDVDRGTLSGHTTPLPVVGDELHCLMQSGKTGKFIFTRVKPCGDPSDMWFGTVKYTGYVEKEAK